MVQINVRQIWLAFLLPKNSIDDVYHFSLVLLGMILIFVIIVLGDLYLVFPVNCNLYSGLALDPVARMAAHWHIPVISSGGPHVQFQNKEIFTTLTRLSFSLNNLGTFIRKLFQLFEWKHVSMIVQDKSSSPLIPLVKETVVDSFENTEQLLDHVSVELHEISRRLQKVNLRSLLMDCAKESRGMNNNNDNG